MALLSGTVVGPYRLLGLLGSGGMGEVYRAADDRLGRDVAVKVLHSSFAVDPDRVRRFDREARAAAALNHPNIIAVHDIGTHEGEPYIVSELLRGRTLRDMLGHGALVTRKAVEYGIAVANGLAAAHENGILHRDIKPENVFITDDGRVKILDFGLAKLREPVLEGGDATSLTADPSGTEGMVFGTAGYISPEQVRGAALDHRTDIFSLGAVLYEMVSGERAFKGDTQIDTLSAILTHDPPLLNTSNTAIPPPLANVIQHCLEKDREQRFQSARDLTFALTRLTGITPSDTLATQPARPPRWSIVAAAAGALLLAVGAGAYFGRPVADGSPPHFRRLTFERGHVATARFAPEAQTVISTASWEGKPFEVLSTRIDTAESTLLPIPGATLLSVSRSGDLAVIVKDHVLATVPLGGGGVRERAEHVAYADWAGDGSLAAIRQEDRRSWLEYPLGKPLYEPPNAMVVVRVSPDGALMAVMEQQGFGGGLEWVSIVDRHGTVVSRSRKWASNVADSLAWTPDGREVWFTASDVAGRAAIQAMTRDGRERTVFRSMGSVRILDLAGDGRALLANDSFRTSMSMVDANEQRERSLTWKDWSRPTALSDDGRTLVFGDLGRTSTSNLNSGYIRATDASPAVKLSEAGTPKALSPDGKWVVTSAPTGDPHLSLVPTGAGEPRPLQRGRLVAFNAIMNGTRFTPDGERIVFVGSEAGRPRRVFIQTLAGGPPEAVTPERAFGSLVVSRDSVIVNDPEGRLSKYPLAGGTVTAVAGALARDEPLAWSPDRESIWVLSRTTKPARISRIDLKNGRRTFWREVPYPDPAAIEFDQLRVVMSADGSRFVYGYREHLSELYVVQGLR